MAERRDFPPEVLTILRELMRQSPNFDLPEEQERIKNALVDRVMRDPEASRALLTASFENIWDDLEREKKGKRGGPAKPKKKKARAKK